MKYLFEVRDETTCAVLLHTEKQKEAIACAKKHSFDNNSSIWIIVPESKRRYLFGIAKNNHFKFEGNF